MGARRKACSAWGRLRTEDPGKEKAGGTVVLMPPKVGPPLNALEQVSPTTHHEEGRIDDSPCRGDDLAPAPVQGLLGNHCIEDLKLDISNH